MGIPDELLGMLMAAGGLAVGVAVLLVARRRLASRLRALEGAFEPASAQVSGLIPTAITGRWQGYAFRYTLQMRSNNSPGGATATSPVRAPFDWRAVVVGHGPRTVNLAMLGLQQLGLLKDVEVGDPDLDRRLRFSAKDPQELTVAFGTTGVRRAMSRLLELKNFRSVAITKGKLTAAWTPRDPALDEDVATVRARLSALVNLASALGCSPLL